MPSSRYKREITQQMPNNVTDLDENNTMRKNNNVRGGANYNYIIMSKL